MERRGLGEDRIRKGMHPFVVERLETLGARRHRFFEREQVLVKLLDSLVRQGQCPVLLCLAPLKAVKPGPASVVLHSLAKGVKQISVGKGVHTKESLSNAVH